jgi:hypothetical protein
MNLIEVLFRNNAIELKYEDQGEPVVLIVTPEFVASQGAPRPTLFELQNYIIDHATELKIKAAECMAQGCRSQILS